MTIAHWPSWTSIDRSSSRNLQRQVRWLTRNPKKSGRSGELKQQKWESLPAEIWFSPTKTLPCRILPAQMMICAARNSKMGCETIIIWNQTQHADANGYTTHIHPPIVKMNFGWMEIYIQDHARFRWLQVDKILLGFQEPAASCCFLSILAHEYWCFAGERTIQ